ncbi:hypothetical protein BC937DRAFT_90020 [Endogone sp. FLAS-F59071]|nr:hypothetical protein BC937DRAFT_90020 [Endogone sp. FLAS-F59071]|eukprot:RUS17399.1 hypothetical protein BC937DRAFT_90020 [Endogone sp. FLAS-F59071]
MGVGVMRSHCEWLPNLNRNSTYGLVKGYYLRGQAYTEQKHFNEALADLNKEMGERRKSTDRAAVGAVEIYETESIKSDDPEKAMKIDHMQARSL